ncbi:MAG TPA: cytidine deaminase [Anaerolineae bacterium]|nr:cytidine deaminase [Caldilineae bacterium]HID34293.1 cytidine deaminase [Anaerolineae bacterium]HIQ12573.1 cytidine deaminase [Caldilineales bacterium]
MTDIDVEALIEQAKQARSRAYAPYSHYHVGAAVLTEDGRVFTGCNVENAVYPLGLCAERVAIFKAVSEGYRKFRAIAVVTRNGGSPCGSCRQVMHEFAPEMVVFIADDAGDVRRTTVADLLPDSFGADDLAR